MIVANVTSSAIMEGDLIIRIEEKAGKFGPYPAFTVERTDDPRIEAALEYPGRPEGAERVTVAEAAALQSYPANFVWDVTLPDGKPVTRTKQFLQISNAVPPLLAEAILRAVIS